MVDLYGKEIKVGQKVAFSVMFGRRGTSHWLSSHWLSIGEVIEVRKTEKREYCKVKTIKHGTNRCYGDKEYGFIQDASTFNNKILILSDKVD